jgi:hypothetical protein
VGGGFEQDFGPSSGAIGAEIPDWKEEGYVDGLAGGQS